MKLTKNSNILLVGLALILSLVSFTGVTNRAPTEVVKTALVVNDYGANTRYAIAYKNATKKSSDVFKRFSEYAFTAFQKAYSIEVNSVFKTYKHKTIGLSAMQLHTKHYTLSIHKTLYNDIV